MPSSSCSSARVIAATEAGVSDAARRRAGRAGRVVPLALGLAVLVGACIGGAQLVAPTVSGAWIRPPAGTNVPAAAYLVITNTGTQGDVLLRASSPSAASVEIHDTTTDMNGMTGMAPVARVDVPAGATVTFAPGGLHLMVMGIMGSMVVGQKFELDLQFQNAGRVVVQADVRQN